jgi:hypothetical protein
MKSAKDAKSRSDMMWHQYVASQLMSRSVLKFCVAAKYMWELSWVSHMATLQHP